MPKDATKNVDRYKIRGGHLNEYEYQQDKTAEQKQTEKDKERLEKQQATDSREKAATPREKVDKTDAPTNPKH